MKIQLQPNIINDVSALSLAAGFDITDLNVTVEYLSGGTKGQKVFLANTDELPIKTDSSSAQAILVCDNDNSKSTRSTCAITGGTVYAWFDSTNTSPINVLIG